MEVATEEGIDDRAENSTKTEYENLSGVGILSGKTEGSRVLVVNLMDVLVEGTPMKSLVGYDVLSASYPMTQ